MYIPFFYLKKGAYDKGYPDTHLPQKNYFCVSKP